MENYQEICYLLCVALRKTRQYGDLWRLRHVEENDARYVIAEFTNGGTRVINVTMDSGIAMIKDIIKNL